MGSLGLETAWKAATGQPIEKNVDTGTEMVTKDNAAKFQYADQLGAAAGSPPRSPPQPSHRRTRSSTKCL
jgi:hypothetical protein